MRTRLMLLLLPVLSLAACKQDPFERPFTWTATGANDANLRAMVADTRDLTAGRGDTGSVGDEAARPISRMLAGNRAQLPHNGASVISVDTTPQSGGNDAGQSK